MNKAPCQRSHGLRFEPGTAANRTVFKAHGHTDWTNSTVEFIKCFTASDHFFCLAPASLNCGLARHDGRAGLYSYPISLVYESNTTAIITASCASEWHTRVWIFKHRHPTRPAADCVCYLWHAYKLECWINSFEHASVSHCLRIRIWVHWPCSLNQTGFGETQKSEILRANINSIRKYSRKFWHYWM